MKFFECPSIADVAEKDLVYFGQKILTNLSIKIVSYRWNWNNFKWASFFNNDFEI